MEEGYIGITGKLFDVSWYRKPTLFGFSGEPLTGWGVIASNLEAHRCVVCRRIISKY